ncbi:CBS domain-containing protein [Cryptosporangium sp. NPDC048952]|uniref:CBS domain-containing protein n=1 Tax=Cryptosporangium sp. NPDC048952 TaxID=3363961 RepID=UPI0037174C4B
MLARDLVRPYPLVTADSDAFTAAKLVAERDLQAVLVTDGGPDGAPYAVLPAARLLELIVPAYILDDPRLAAVVDEPHADRLCDALAGRRVADCLPEKHKMPPVVAPDDTALEVATLMVRERSPLVVVVEDGRTLGVISSSHLLDRLLAIT